MPDTDSIAIAHKDYDVRGGGEMLAETLADGLDAPLIVGHGNPEHEPEDKDLEVIEIGESSHWHKLAARGGLVRAIAHMMLWRDHADAELKNYDTIVTSGNEPQWWMPREDQTWVAYTHSTPRWLYDLYHKLDGWPTRTVNQIKRWIYQQDMDGPNLWVANSDIVERRMKRYWGIRSDNIRVVYPPIETELLGPHHADTQEYYLSLGRLAEVKRVETIIEAANDLDIPLKIAGTGPKEAELKAKAGETVEFLGWVDGQRKRELLSGARALISASMNEDFGMVPIEAIASGTPVLTINEGMPKHTVLQPETGYHYNQGDLVDSIQQFRQDGVEWSEQQMAQWATENFGVQRFITEIKDAIAEAERRNRIETDLRKTPEVKQ